MNDPAMDASLLWPLVVYGAAAVLLVAGMLALSFVLGQRHRERSTGEPYESGVTPTGSARVRFDIKFYLVAMFFLIFDLEAAYLYAWAVSVREAGWVGFAEAAFFIAVLSAALAYLWKMGALDWGRKRPTQGRGDAGTR